MLDLKLDRPLAVFDIESTGTNRRVDRIIDLAILKVHPGGRKEQHLFRVNPGMPIPPEATAVHGITNDDVKDSPSFKDIAGKVMEVLKDCDLCGYNILSFDIPLLMEEFARVGMSLNLETFRILDAQRIFHRRVPRDLSAALQYYCGEFHLGAHGAMEDVLATLRVVEGQLERYADLPRDLDALDAYCNPRDPAWVDRAGKLKWVDGEMVINFGKNQGQKVRDLVKKDPGFLKWMVRNDFPKETTTLIENALKGEFPKPPERTDP